MISNSSLKPKLFTKYYVLFCEIFVLLISTPPGTKKQKKSLSGWHRRTMGICKEPRKSWRSGAPEDGTDEGPHALSLRSAESGMHKAFLMNRSGARPEVLRNA